MTLPQSSIKYPQITPIAQIEKDKTAALELFDETLFLNLRNLRNLWMPDLQLAPLDSRLSLC